MMDETPLSPGESLAFIQGVIARTKGHYRDNSFYFLLWGWLIAVAGALFFVLHEYTKTTYYFLPFPVLAATGIVTSGIHYRKHHKPAETYTDFFFTRLWLVVGIGFIVTVAVAVSQRLSPLLFTIVIAGIGTLVSGLILQFRPLIAGGVLFFAAAIAGIFIPDGYRPLLLTVAIVLGYLIPGYQLKGRQHDAV